MPSRSELHASATRSRRLRMRAVSVLAVAVACFGLFVAGQGASASASTMGREYFVAPWGSNTAPGTLSAPFASIQHGMGQLRAGDRLTVRGGTYRERVVLSYTSITPGRADAPIVVQNYPGERPVIEGRLRLSGADHWTVRGINVTWSSLNAATEHMVVFRGGTNWRFTDAEVWGARSFAAILVGDGATNYRLDHLYVHHTYATNARNQDHLIYIGERADNGMIERNVLAHSPNGRGVKVGPGSLSKPGSNGVIIRYNTFFGNRGPGPVRFSGRSSNNQVYRNIMVQSASGVGAVSSYKLTGTGNVAYDNVVWRVRRPVDTSAGLADRGGNVMLDPKFRNVAAGDFRPASAAARGYGAHAPGDTTTTTTAPTTR